MIAKTAVMKRGRAASIIDEVVAAVKKWPKFAAKAKLPVKWMERIKLAHRLSFPER